MSFDPERDRHDDLLNAIHKAAHQISNAITEGFKAMANAETQALADLANAVTAIGLAITNEIGALQAALGAAGVDNSPAIEASVTKLNSLTSSLTASLPVPPPTVVPAPTVTAIAPAVGPIAGGTTVTLTGIGFKTATGVTVGGVAGTALAIASDTSLTFVTPATTAGAQPVVVTNPGGASAPVTFTTS
jgi:IPT/TIG domain